MYRMTGELKVIADEIQVTDKFKKKEFVLMDDSSQYPQYINFQLTQDRCGLLNDFSIGQRLTVDFNLRGREWTDKNNEIKYFNSLDVWRIESETTNLSSDISSKPNTFIDDDEGDGLPF